MFHPQDEQFGEHGDGLTLKTDWKWCHGLSNNNQDLCVKSVKQLCECGRSCELTDGLHDVGEEAEGHQGLGKLTKEEF